MKVYDPRLDTAPGEHVDDERYHVETTNPMLLMAYYHVHSELRELIDWDRVVRMANVCDESVGPPTVFDVVQGSKDNR